MPPEKNHISICVCTYKRTDQLKRLLEELPRQYSGGAFSFSVVVVDNDQDRSAERMVNRIAAESQVVVDYFNEPARNIALARNMAVSKAKGDFVAFIDDDEYPSPDWLARLFRSIHRYEAQGILGPVKPDFTEPPPKWIVQGKICERDSFPTGTILTNSRYTRTGNVLLSAKLFRCDFPPFNPEFGRTGGEDVDFFRRMMGLGKKFVWDNEATVYESVPPERMKRTYFLKRGLLRGFVASRKPSLGGVLKSIVAAGSYTMLLPVFFLFGQHLFMKYLIKDCDHLGKLLGVCGIKPLTERRF